MYLVRDVFKVKFNQLHKVMATLQAAAEAFQGDSGLSRIFTDVSGGMFTLVSRPRLKASMLTGSGCSLRTKIQRDRKS